jgi:hypothetical protein
MVDGETMTDFDPLKAQREIVAGIHDIYRVIQARARSAEQHYAEAESDYNSMMKIEQFTKELLAQAQAKLQRLTEEAEKK